MENVKFNYGKWHELKVWPSYFNAIITEVKNFEVRKNDRGFQRGDYLRLREWDPNAEQYTGAEVTRQIEYILHGGEFGVEKGYCVMSLSRV